MPDLKTLVWIKGTTIPNYDLAIWRRDVYGNAILFLAYGNRDSDYGWEIDRITPVAEGGSDDIKEIFKRLPPAPVAGSIPLQLTDFGKQIAENPEAFEWARQIAPS